MDTRYFVIFVSACLVTVDCGLKYFHIREIPFPSGLPSTARVKAWPGGMVGRIRVPIRNDVTNGWEMILHFPRKVLSLEVSGAKIKDVGLFQKHYVIENEEYNAQLMAGTKLNLLFVARTYKFVSGLKGNIEFLPKVDKDGPVTNFSVQPAGRNMTDTEDDESTVRNMTDSVSECFLTCGTQVVIVSQWPSNFEGKVTFQLHSAIRNGWTATLYFPQNIVTDVQIWNAERTDSYHDGPRTVIKIKNKSWNTNISGTFEFNFIVTIAEAVGYQFYAHMDDQPPCACSIEED